MPEVVVEIEANFYLLRRLLGVKAEGSDKRQAKVTKLKADEMLMINIGSTSLGGKILSVKSVSIGYSNSFNFIGYCENLVYESSLCK